MFPPVHVLQYTLPPFCTCFCVFAVDLYPHVWALCQEAAPFWRRVSICVCAAGRRGHVVRSRCGRGARQGGAGDRAEVERYVAKARRSGCGVILTGYEVLRRHADVLLPLDWGYVALDEGHKISNPDTEITLICKQARVPPPLPALAEPSRSTHPSFSFCPWG